MSELLPLLPPSLQPLLVPLLVLISALSGAALTLFFLRGRSALRMETALAQLTAATAAELAQLRERAARIPELEAQLADLNEQLKTSQQDAHRLQIALTAAETQAREAARSASEKLQLLHDAKQSLSDQFEALAGAILEEKSKRFAEQNQTSIKQILEPLKDQISEFKGKVEQVYVQEGKDRSALSEQVRQLLSLNQALSQEAKNLTSALKGSAKTQGNWGELILVRVLESAGLRKGFEYQVQESHAREDGSRAQPDVVIELPEERRLVVDAKVSLVAYEAYVVADNDEDRQAALRRHLDSIRSHIKGLGNKQYQDLYALKSLDFVLLFVPVEPAFMLAVTQDGELFMDAWERNVLLVSPSTLLFVVRTVAHLWRQEQQSRNAQEIAKRGAELYDRLAGFVGELEQVGLRLSKAQDAYSEAHRKLATGKGNVIRQAELLKDLGIKPSKSLPEAVLETMLTDSEAATLAVAVAPADPNGATTP